MAEVKKAEIRKIAAAKTMRKLMADHFYELDRAAREGTPKIAWCTSVGPAELLRAMGFLVYFPENHGAMLGATRMANETIPAANAVGYSPDICSYLTSDIGSTLQGRTPLTDAYEGIDSVPKPDVLVYNTNQCREVQDWMAWYGNHWSRPVLGVECYRNVGEVTDVHVAGIAGQLKAMVPELEKIAGQPLDLDRLRETVRLSRLCSDLWKEVLETAAARPSPLTFFDSTIHMAPAVVMRGTQTAIDYYNELLPELRARIDQGVGAVEGEQYRLYWEGMPIWGRLRDLATQFLELKTCVVASTYANSWIFTALDPDDPFDSMARAYTELFIVRSDPHKEQYLEEMIQTFGVDGIIFHDSKTCPTNTNCRHGMPERIRDRLGVPSITIAGDLNDLRCYSDEQAKTQIEAFVEQLATRVGG
ncbi:MAG: 2-hydroxyacyl-CoA dehydratase family protein [Phycisphaerae bacterium]|jgi:benzoyl-CoA reductase/2-hydroxyglutaryl-CoA dehydratase subunit BcrC/BadD/HgdB